MSYHHILNFETLPYSKKITVPSIVIHSDGAITPHAAKLHFDALAGKKKLVWIDGATQFDFYDNQNVVSQASDAISKWFVKN
jgi:fermentation-respiration switch protein FrsA (DUF1100 family)